MLFKSKRNVKKAYFLNLLFCFAAVYGIKAEAADGISPYVKVGVSHVAGNNNRAGLETDTFIPFISIDNKLLFSNVKMNNYSDNSFDGGFYLGYRFLLPEDQQLYGVYTAFDFKKTGNGNYFNRINFGLEYWLGRWFFGTSVYIPVGERVKNNGSYYAKILPGLGGEVGYEFSKKTSAYVEGYYFDSEGAGTVPGVKIKFKQNLFSKDNSSGILDKVDLEVGVQKDKLLGSRAFLEIAFKIGASSSVAPGGVAAHMADTIYRSNPPFPVLETSKPAPELESSKSDNSKTVKPYRLMCQYDRQDGGGYELAAEQPPQCPANPKRIGSASLVEDQVNEYGDKTLTLRIT